MSEENSDRTTDQPEREDAAPGLDHSAGVKPRAKKTGSKLQTVIVIGLLASAAGFVGWQLLRPGELDASRVAKGPSNIDSTPAGGQLADSERYKQGLNRVNNQGAEQAEQSGSSFIPTPDEPLRNVDDKRVAKDTPPPQRPIAPANPRVTAPVAHVSPERRASDDFSDINALAERMTAQQSALMGQWSPRPSGLTMVIEQELYKTPQQRKAEAEQLSKLVSTTGSDGSPLGETLAKAGEYLFGRTINSSDSDTPGPVVAEIMKEGPLYRARLLGSFQQNTNTNAVIVEFNRLVLQDGREIAISAYAVDARKGSIAVTSGVDKRWLERYGPRIAGAFIEGLGTTLGRVGDQVVVGNNSTTIVQPSATFKQGVYQGVGRIGEELAGEISNSAPKGPLVKLDSGYTVGILFMESVKAPSAPTAMSFNLDR